MNITEIHTTIPGYDDYVISTSGQIRSLKTDRILKQTPSDKGYMTVKLSRDRKGHTYKVHRLMARTFMGEPEPGQEVNHRNGYKWDNALWNLEYCTKSENMEHAYKYALNKRKFSAEYADRIRRERSDGMTIRALADKYKASIRTITNVINRKGSYSKF